MKSILLLLFIVVIAGCSSTKYQKVEMLGWDKYGNFGIHTYKKPKNETLRITPISQYDSMQKLKTY